MDISATGSIQGEIRMVMYCVCGELELSIESIYGTVGRMQIQNYCAIQGFDVNMM